MLQAILESPDDDDVRLIYADWLEDHGDDARAQFIRMQILVHQHNPYRNTSCGCEMCDEAKRIRDELLRDCEEKWLADLYVGYGRRPENTRLLGFGWYRGFYEPISAQPRKPYRHETAEERQQRTLLQRLMWDPRTRRVMRGVDKMTPEQRAALLRRLEKAE
jgi:uncharacterized protein (TIGR02996 family)